MVVQVRLEMPLEDQVKAEEKIRQIAREMNVTVSRVKVREDVVQLYGHYATQEK